jgi:hypothetical protein
MDAVLLTGLVIGGAPRDLIAWMQLPASERGPIKQEWRDWLLEPQEVQDERLFAHFRRLGAEAARKRDEAVLAMLGRQ